MNKTTSDRRVVRVHSYSGISPKLDAALDEFYEKCPDGHGWHGHYGDFDTRLFEKTEYADVYAGCLKEQGVKSRRHPSEDFRKLCR